MRNRLEQLRKRQRDEALFAQRELLAAGWRRNWGGDIRAEAGVTDADLSKGHAEVYEEYSREMSPPLISISTLNYEDRQIDIIHEEQDREALVAF